MSIPPALAEIIEDFQAVPERDRLMLLLDFSKELPELPARFGEHPELLERVPECQSPLFLTVEKGEDDAVNLFFSAPAEAPTTRGFASILAQGLNGLPAADIAAVPQDMVHQLGLDPVVSPLRMRGMGAMLVRIQRQVKDKFGA